MRKILYLDCSTGIAGDMLLAALADLGTDITKIKNQLALLNLGEWQMNFSQVNKNGIFANQLMISFPPQHHHRTYDDICVLLENVIWPQTALQIAKATFKLLAEAEAQVHGCEINQVHFHETGAIDSLLDICGAALALDQLGIDQVYFSQLPLSSGYVDCEHGRLPLPAPATAILLKGMQLFPSNLIGETITPTGAAILKGSGGIQALPSICIDNIGHGAGSKDFPQQPNVLRAMIGMDTSASFSKPGIKQDQVSVLRTNIDDASGELLGQLWDKAFALGALDMTYTPLLMKKGRPAWALELIVKEENTEDFAALVFDQTSSIGLRISKEARFILSRNLEKIATPYGEITIKVSGDTISPEADEVAAAAAIHQTTFKVVYQATLAAYLNHPEKTY